MKRNIITLVVAVVIVAAIVLINQYGPNRRTNEQIEASEETQAQIEQAEQVEAEYAGAESSDESDGGSGESESAGTESGEDVSDQNIIRVKFECSNGDVIAELHQDWSPKGVEQFLKAAKDGVYDGARFFRVVPGVIAQVGIPGDPELAAKWRDMNIEDEPVKQSNKRGTLAFAKSQQPDSRTTQIFINLADRNAFLDNMGFSPFGEIVEGMEVVDDIESKYGEQPDQGQIQARGNEYLNEQFPDLDYIKKVTVIESD